MWIPHSILGHFLDHGFTTWQAENRVSIVLCPTNTTQTSVIYKLTEGLAGCSTEHYIFIVPYQSRTNSIFSHFFLLGALKMAS